MQKRCRRGGHANGGPHGVGHSTGLSDITAARTVGAVPKMTGRKLHFSREWSMPFKCAITGEPNFFYFYHIVFHPALSHCTVVSQEFTFVNYLSTSPIGNYATELIAQGLNPPYTYLVPAAVSSFDDQCSQTTTFE